VAKFVALVALHLCARQGEVGPDGKIIRPAEIDVKPPGSIVELSDKDAMPLKDAGHIRLPTEDELLLDKATRGRKGRDDDDAAKIAAAEKALAAAKAALEKADEAGKAAAEAAVVAAETELAKLKG